MNYTVIGYRLENQYQAIYVEAETVKKAEINISEYYKQLNIKFKVCFIIEDHPIIHRITN